MSSGYASFDYEEAEYRQAHRPCAAARAVAPRLGLAASLARQPVPALRPRTARPTGLLPAACCHPHPALLPPLAPVGSRPPPGTCRQAHLQRLDILINGEPVDALARVVHRDKAQVVGRRLCAKLRVSWGPGQAGD